MNCIVLCEWELAVSMFQSQKWSLLLWCYLFLVTTSTINRFVPKKYVWGPNYTCIVSI